MKLYPPCGYSPDDRSLFPYYEICRELHLPVLTHIGPTTATLPFRYTQPQCVDDAAFHFPEVNFILGHAALPITRMRHCWHSTGQTFFLIFPGFRRPLIATSSGTSSTGTSAEGWGESYLFGTDWPIHDSGGISGTGWKNSPHLNPKQCCRAEEMNNILGNNLLGILPQAARKHAKYGT